MVNRHIGPALQHHWGESKAWHTTNWEKDTTGVISRAAASVFVGPKKSSDTEWQAAVQGYVREYFASGDQLHAWEALFRPVVQWALPHASACRNLMRRARIIMDDVVQKRTHEAEATTQSL